MKPQTLLIAEIGFDPHYYPRVSGKDDYFHTNILREALLADPKLAVEMEPIVAVRDKRTALWKFTLVDGLHRCKAFRAAGYDRVPAVVESLPKSKWLSRSVELNIRQHRQFEASDRAWIAQRLESDGWKAKDVANLLQMRPKTLERIVMERIQKITSAEAKALPMGRGNRKVNGDHYGFLKAPFKPLVGTAAGTHALDRQGPVTAKSVVNILDSVIAILETSAIDLSDVEVTGRLRAIKKLLRPLKLTAMASK